MLIVEIGVIVAEFVVVELVEFVVELVELVEFVVELVELVELLLVI